MTISETLVQCCMNYTMCLVTGIEKNTLSIAPFFAFFISFPFLAYMWPSLSSPNSWCTFWHLISKIFMSNISNIQISYCPFPPYEKDSNLWPMTLILYHTLLHYMLKWLKLQNFSSKMTFKPCICEKWEKKFHDTVEMWLRACSKLKKKLTTNPELFTTVWFLRIIRSSKM